MLLFFVIRQNLTKEFNVSVKLPHALPELRGNEKIQ